MATLIAEVKVWLAQLAPRERLALLAGLILGAVILGYLLLLDPIFRARGELRGSVRQQEQELAWMRDAAREVRRLMGAGSVAAPGGSPLAAIDASARQLGLGTALKRVEPGGRDEVRVWLEDAPFDELMRWLALLQGSHGISAGEVVVEPGRSGAGLVNARLTLLRRG